MNELELRELDSISQLRAMTAEWDALWQLGGVTLPTARAELVAIWLEHFAPDATLRLLTVRQAGRLVAALPLVGGKAHSLVQVGDLTMNHWSPNGELLLDPAADRDAVMDLLASAIGGLPWPLLWLEMVPIEEPRWKEFVAALGRKRLSVDIHIRYRIGQIATGGDFEAYQARLSKNLRRSLRRDSRRLEETGPVQFVRYRSFTREEVDEHLRCALRIEDLGWKGEAGGSVLHTPGMFDFYRRQCGKLAELGHLRIAFLLHRGEPIAFELGWTAKGVYHSFKVGYDPAYKSFGPGHLARLHLIRSLFERPDNRLVDFQGPISEALGAWSTGSYPIGRLVIAPRRISSRCLLAAYRTLAPAVRRLRG